MKDDQGWKKKYYDLEKKQKNEHTSNKETQELLTRTIIRLTLATKGLDPALDPHLQKLRDSLKKGINTNAQRHMASISEALMRAQSTEPKKTAKKGDSVSDLMQRLSAQASLSGHDGKRIKVLERQIASNPGKATDHDLDEYIHLLTGYPQGDRPDVEDGPGLLGRIFGRSGGEDDAQGEGGAALRMLLSLLGELDWPSKLSDDISSLGGRLEQHDRDAMVAVVKELTKIVSNLLNDLHKETRATGSFLADLMARLHELDKYVVGGQVIQQESLQSGKELDRAVKEQVGDIATSVRDAEDLQVLKHDVSSHLEAIKGHMDKHLNDAEERFRESQKNEQKLRERLQEVEDETGILRHKIMEAQARSSIDAVTGLPNRAAYDERLQDEYGRWRRFKSPLVLMMWDLDDFKQVNDRFGHQAGDKALRVIGQIMEKRLRQTDFVGRYGGEEFCVLLPGTPMDQAAVVAEQIRKSVENGGFRSGTKPITLTVSCGYTEFQDSDTPESVFARADRAMYKAKNQGKNCCVSS